MLVLISTRDTQGDLSNDYSHTVEGELVTPVAVECCEPRHCGCGRGFPGLASSKATTTALIAERPAITPKTLRCVVSDSLERGGWRSPEHPTEFDELVDEHVVAISAICGELGEGVVVRRSGPSVWVLHESDAA